MTGTEACKVCADRHRACFCVCHEDTEAVEAPREGTSVIIDLPPQRIEEVEPKGGML